MQTACRSVPRIIRMHSLRKLLQSKVLLDPTGIRFAFSSATSTAKTAGIRCLSRRFGSSGWGAVDCSVRSSDEEPEGSPGTDDPAEGRKVWTFYDPLDGNLVTQVAEEDGRAEGKLGEVDESTKTGMTVQKVPVARFRKVESDTGKEDRKRVFSRSVSNSNWVSTARRKSGKTKVSWVCENCGATTGQWWGSCQSCQAMNTIRQFTESASRRSAAFEVSEAATRLWLPHRTGEAVPQSLVEVNKGMNQLEWRIPLPGHFGMEVSRVLGGGLVPGSLVLVGGDPGVGKSTMLLQMAASLAEGFDSKSPERVIYVSGEESIDQIGNRADRMRISTPELYLYSSTDIEMRRFRQIFTKTLICGHSGKNSCVFSQSSHCGFHTNSLPEGSCGKCWKYPAEFFVGTLEVHKATNYCARAYLGVGASVFRKVKECTSALLRFAKQTNVPVFLIGHVTKAGDIAGPRILEHIVDVVLYLEGERYSSYRLLRSVKNRFGSTDELGVFEMSETGLQAVLNPSEIFLSENYSDSEVLAGLAVAVIVDGSRAFLIEIQALCVSGSTVGRQVNGVSGSRADMIIAVLMKQAGLKLQDMSIFLNVVSGFKLTETAGDLAVAMAICSSLLEVPLPNDVAFIGEVGLGGELRPVPRMDKRINAVAKLGYRRCVIPKSAEKSIAPFGLNVEIVGCKDLKEVIRRVFRGD